MFFNIEGRDDKYRTELKNFIEVEYQLKISSINEHVRGWYGETWKLICESDDSSRKKNPCKYFAKIIYFKKQAKKYMQCFPVLYYMKEKGIDYISSYISSRSGRSYLLFKGGTLALFDFAEGLHIDDKPLTLVPLMTKIYSLPPPDFPIESETFASNVYSDLEEQIKKLHLTEIEAYDIVNSNCKLLMDVNIRMKHYAEIAQTKTAVSTGSSSLPLCFGITSGDIGGNTLVNNGRYTIIDWDWIMLAPPERDFWWYIQDPAQIIDINMAFKEIAFNYSLDMDIIAYYTHFSYLYFLTETIDCLLFNPLSKSEVIQRLNEHFDKDGFLRKNLRNCLT